MPDVPFPDPANSETPEDFSKVGEQIFTAALKVAIEHLDGKKVGVFIADVIGQVLGVAALSVAPIGIGLAKGIANAEDVVAPALGDMAATAVSDMFGVDVPASSFQRGRGRTAAGNAGEALGAGFMRAMEGQGGPLEPNDEAAKRYLGVVLNMALEGWWQGWFFEFMSSLIPQFDIGKIESFADLDDTVSQALGLGRLSRRVVSPLIDATVVTPLRWKVNKQYRPELLSAAAAVEAYQTGQWSSAQLIEELARQGWSDERIGVLENNARKRLGVSQILEYWYRGGWPDSQAIAALRELGYDQQTAAELLDLEVQTRRQRHFEGVVSATVSAYVNGTIGEGELNSVLNEVTFGWRDAEVIRVAARMRRALEVRELSSSDERRLALKKIRSVVDYRRALEREGYDPGSVTALELELRMEIDQREDVEAAKRDAALEREQAAAAAAAAKAARDAELAARKALPTRQEYQRAYVRGRIDRPTFAAAIVREKVAITPGDLELLLADADEARAEWLAQLEKAAAARERKVDPGLSVAQLEAAVLADVLTLPEFDARLAQFGYDDDERRVLTSLLGAKLEDRADARRRRDEAAAAAEVKQVSLPNFERAVRLGLRTRAQYAALLDELATPEISKALILDLLDEAMRQDAAAREARERNDPPAATRGLSLAQRRRAVVAGVLPRAAYEAALVEAQWSADDALVELALLDLELAEAAAARARRDQVAAELEAKRLAEEEARRLRELEAAQPPEPPTLTLAQVERAVRLGLLPPDALRAWLLERGYSEADRETIVSLAVAAIPDVRAGQQVEERAAAALAQRGISHGDLKAAVRRGIRTLDDYAAELEASNFGVDDVALLRQLLEEEIAIDLEGLRQKIAAVLEKAEGAPPLEEIDAAFAAGEVDVEGVREVLAMFTVPRDTALVYARLLLSFLPTE